LIIEFSGLPRSGKSTTLDAIKNFYTRQGYDVKLLIEGVRTCPFPHHHRVKTAFWTIHKVINDIIKYSTISTKDTLILQDRGLFDAMAFIKLLKIDALASVEDIKLLDDFCACEGVNNFLSFVSNWAKFVDLVILFETPPEVVLDRDLASRMNAGPALITNSNTLRSLMNAYKCIKNDYGEMFPKLVSVKTHNRDKLDIAIQIKNLINDELLNQTKSK